MNKMLMITFGMYVKSYGGQLAVSSNERTERQGAAREGSKIHGRMQ